MLRVDTEARDSLLRIRRSALESIVGEAALSLDGHETGGVLLGHTENGVVSIRHAGGPGPRARRTPVTFDRDLDFAAQLAARVWDRDRSEWVGEWHTHPMGALIPSARDLNSYLTHLADPQLGFDQFICIIAGTPNDSGIPLAAWIVLPDGAHRIHPHVDEQE